MPATSSLTNVILGAIAAGVIASSVFAAVTLPSGNADSAVSAWLMDSGHSHKGDRLPLYQAEVPSLTVSAPAVRQFGIIDADGATNANTIVALKNVIVVKSGPDRVAAQKPRDGEDADELDPSQQTTRPASCKVVTGPALTPNLGRLVGRCFS